MTKPGDSDWNSFVGESLRVDDPDSIKWDDTADVVAVGFGGAGACAALEARAAGVDVLVMERFDGGGATALSGGIYYGGATRFLREAGFEDTPEQMYRYLKLEIGDVVKDETLRRFCESSSANLDWLVAHGARFGSKAYEGKTTYPPAGYDLYFSGNERGRGFVEHAEPAPRGHRMVGKGFTGGALYRSLHATAIEKGVRIRTQSPVTKLLIDRNGRVIGVEANVLTPNSSPWREHRKLIRKVNTWQRFFEGKALKSAHRVAEIERQYGKAIRIRARNGVVLTTGSFAFNRQMVATYAPKYASAMPLGSLGCDGSGIRLGETVGAAIGRMSSVTAWRSISPPVGFVKGVVVSRSGTRFISEDAYLGHLGRAIAEHADGCAWIIVDKQLFRSSFRDTLPTPGSSWMSFGLPLLINLLTNAKKAPTLERLAAELGMDPVALRETVEAYNAGAASGEDAFGKSKNYLRVLSKGPFYAIDISLGNKRFACPSIPMGGLVVDEATGHVLRADGSRIAGLYAAGRTAVGIPSGFYVSGSAIADFVFAGRRAGRSVSQVPETSSNAEFGVAAAR